MHESSKLNNGFDPFLDILEFRIWVYAREEWKNLTLPDRVSFVNCLLASASSGLNSYVKTRASVDATTYTAGARYMTYDDVRTAPRSRSFTV